MQIKVPLPMIFGVPGRAFLKNFKEKKAFVAELRPGLEGSKTVAKELLKKKVKPVMICDNMMAFCMQQGIVSDVHIFYDKIRGQVAVCRTGSLIAALAAKAHNITVYIYQASSVKQKAHDLRKIGGKMITVPSVKTYVPYEEEVPLELVKIRG